MLNCAQLLKRKPDIKLLVGDVTRLMLDSLLDNLDEIRKIDRSNMLSFQVEAADHYEKALSFAEKVSVNFSMPENVVVSGMGGSAISGELAKDWVLNRASMPIEVCRDYTLPKYVSAKTLVVVSSYSGETEESLGSFLDARRKGSMICCISSGGKLLEFADRFGIPSVRVPAGMPPRVALPYLFIPLLKLLEKAGIISGLSEEFREAKGVLEKVAKDNGPENVLRSNPAKTLAAGVSGTVPVVYGFGLYRGVAQRFKQQFNENSKVPSKWEFFPELDHNEIMSWQEKWVLTKHFSSIFLRDMKETEDVRGRIEITKMLMEPVLPRQFEVWSLGDCDFARMLSTLLVGDFASVYLAVLRKIDPTPVETISILKRKLDKVGTKARIIRELEKISKDYA